MSTLAKITWLHQPQQVAEAALAGYGLSATRLTAMSSTSNAVFRAATAGGDVVLRLHRFHEQDKPATDWVKYIISEMLWLQALSRDTDLDVPHPLVNRQDGLVTLVDNGADEPVLCSVLGWMEGRFYNKGLRAAHLAKVGELTAHLHNYSASGQFVPPPDFHRARCDAIEGPARFSQFTVTHSDALEVIDYLGSLCRELDAHIARMVTASVARVWADLADFGVDNDHFGLIHGDIHQWNYLFGQGQPKLIDFDNVGYAHYLYDFAVILNNVADRADYPALRDAALQAYQRIRPLPTHHRRYIRSLIALRNLQLIQWTLIWPAGSPERQSRWYDVEESLVHLCLYTANEDNW